MLHSQITQLLLKPLTERNIYFDTYSLSVRGTIQSDVNAECIINI